MTAHAKVAGQPPPEGDTGGDRQAEIPLAQAARLLGCRRGGRPTLPKTLRAWALHGLPEGDPAPVRLRTWLSGGIRMTSLAAIDEFNAELERRRECARRQERAELETPAKQRKRQEQAKRKLEELGLR